MTPINLETEIVATRHDAAKAINYYTLSRHGSRWTVAVPTAALDACGRSAGHKQRRGLLIANRLTEAMRGPPDHTQHP